MSKEKNEVLIQKRLQDNQAILEHLKQYLNDNPYTRFSQALSNLKIVKDNVNTYGTKPYDWVNEFYIEPEEILKRIKPLVIKN